MKAKKSVLILMVVVLSILAGSFVTDSQGAQCTDPEDFVCSCSPNTKIIFDGFHFQCGGSGPGCELCIDASGSCGWMLCLQGCFSSCVS